MNADLAWAHAAALEMGEQHALSTLPPRPRLAPVTPVAVEPVGDTSGAAS